MSILNQLKNLLASPVVGSVLKPSGVTPKGKNAKLVAVLLAVAGLATAAANYLS